MILSQLVAYADRLERDGKALPFMYTPQVIPWLIDLDQRGQLRGPPRRTSSGALKGKDPGKTFNAPNVVRGVDIKPKLLADKAEFVFGLGDGNPERLAKQRQAFLKLTQACAEASGRGDVRAVATFLEQLDPVAFHAEHLADKPDYKSADQFAFVVDGQLLIELPDVQRYWAEICAPAAEEAVQAQSLISGEFGPTISIEPVKIKGIFGGQMAGMNYISANASAFESYGLRGSRIAPVGFDEARKYATALNVLLSDRKTSLSVGGVSYAFWTSEGDVPPVGPLIQNPEVLGGEVKQRRLLGAKRQQRAVQSDPAEYRDALNSIFRPPGVTLSSAAAFYSLGMTPSGSRIAVRTHLQSTVAETTARLAAYFASQAMAPMSEEHDGKLYGIYELIGAMYRDPKKDKTEADTEALIRHAPPRRPDSHGTALPPQGV
ncbi:type I-C CRISPR-associated protein Cas8c/Csd1 [Deinococcus frigens]|uniref:type I-C CRISPR-associated protein Cas8c/Csd1 n=1 Tax=Deinococcus frigens TaxID=249403 RepID=UPI000497EC0F|nr:type I-C CRISPR-associated protein Cas8c/Csd1 [Deinococcus frigens]